MAGWGCTITGIQEAQRANLRALAAVKPSGELGRAVIYVLAKLHRYAVSITHVISGALRASHRTQYQEARDNALGLIYIDEGAVRPGGGRPAIYGPIEEARGGSHAFYQRTVNEAGPGAVGEALARLIRGMI